MENTVLVAAISGVATVAAALIAIIPHLRRKEESPSMSASGAVPDTSGRSGRPNTRAQLRRAKQAKPLLPSAAASAQPFPLIVHKTYYLQGFFNVGVAQENLFGADGQEIAIYCEISQQPIIGTINRTANTNGTPRIMGGAALRDWFQSNLREMQEIMITVLSPTAIRIDRLSV